MFDLFYVNKYGYITFLIGFLVMGLLLYKYRAVGPIRWLGSKKIYARILYTVALAVGSILFYGVLYAFNAHWVISTVLNGVVFAVCCGFIIKVFYPDK